MDGVLVDAREWHDVALNRALNLFGISISRIDHLTTFDGLPTKNKLELLSIDRGFPKELHSFVNEMKQRYTMELIYTKCRPKFNHEYTLSSLKAKGYKLGVCSNSIRETVDTMMIFTALDRYLDVILSNQDVLSPKPNPEIYLKAISTLSLSPSECLILEDNEHGIKAALAAGAHVLEITDPSDVELEVVLAEIARIDAFSKTA